MVCEKRRCFEVREAEELAALAREKNLIFAVTCTYTGYAMSKVMRKTIYAVSAKYIQDWLPDQFLP